MSRVGRKLAAVAVVLAVSFPGQAAAGEPALVFSGSGWGHGVGLSQYGARAMADGGSTAQEIVYHYFPGSSLRRLNTLSIGSELLGANAPLWVGLLQNQPEITFSVENGVVDLCLDSADECAATAMKGEKWRFGPDGFGQCAFARQAGDGGYVLFAPSGQCSASVRPTSETSTVWLPRKGRSYAHGTLRFRTSPISGRLHLSIQLGIEDYLRGVQELPDFWPGAALEAQAIVSRTLAVFRLVEHGLIDDMSAQRLGLCTCHILDSDPEQVYGGYTAELGHPFWQGWVGASNGQVLVVNNKVIWSRFTSSTGGRTEANDSGGGEYLPYLISVDDAASLSSPADNPYSSWVEELPPSELASIFGFLWLNDIKVTSRHESGTVQTLDLKGIISGRPDTVTTTGNSVRDALGLRSSYFDVAVTPRFSDVSTDHPFAGEILGLSELEVTTGCTATEFCPSDTVTREQMAAFLVRAFNLSASNLASEPFTDDDGSVFESEIETLYQHGITTGCTATEFCPSDTVTREQMAAFLVRALSLR